jgi:hypothetical protein
LIVDGLHVPVNPLSDVAGSAGAVAPTQNGPTGVKVGTTWSSIVISRVAVVAHGSLGVNVYVVVPGVDVLIVDGLHVPVNPLSDVPGSAGAVAPTQNGPTGVKVGTTWSSIVISRVAVVAHGSVGVKVYVVVPGADVLIVDGLHVPVNPLSDVPGSAGAVAPTQNGPTGVKVGTTWSSIVISRVAVVAHGSVGVNV